MKTVHIIVKDGLVQEVFTDRDIDIEVALYDLDADDALENKLDVDVAMLRKTAKKIY